VDPPRHWQLQWHGDQRQGDPGRVSSSDSHRNINGSSAASLPGLLFLLLAALASCYSSLSHPLCLFGAGESHLVKYGDAIKFGNVEVRVHTHPPSRQIQP